MKTGCVTGAKMKKLIRFILLIILVIALIRYLPMALEYTFPLSYRAAVGTCCEKYGVDINLVYGVIKAESGFNADAVSSKGAKGLMQLMDETADECAKQIGREEYDVLEPRTNIELGVYYISRLLDRYDGNEKTALAAYNAGQGNVDKWLREYSKDGESLDSIPFPETEKYVKKVIRYKRIYGNIYKQE